MTAADTSGRTARRRTPNRRSFGSRPVWLVLAGIASVQLGAAFSKQLFTLLEPTAVVWLRLVASSIILLAIARPRLRGRSRVDWRTVLLFGLVLGTMNWAIYQSFARMPLGLAVTIEFLGPLTVALVGSRKKLDLAWVGLAALGVALLGFGGGGVTVGGVVFALLAGAAWGLYIPLSAAVGRGWDGLSGLAVASLVGTVALAPFAIAIGGADLLGTRVLVVGALVGLLSSVIPYSFEMAALRTMPPRVFGILMSLEPAAAAMAGLLVLSEQLGVREWVAVVCVVVASAGVTRSATPPAAPAPD
ncbi:EamA family transporter [Nocardioides sp. HDW12B]|uniref:EamA family transporter n=1 Tax=Nocardioides sp. HDW12B TaxID=2714939 RepID=UPI001F0E1643|nr:EamA family transporter [Nocardioides sp. HDW12B]